MTNRIDKKFKELKRKRQKAFIAFVTAGYPCLKDTKKIVLALEKAGVDIVELGIPFSDPLADGLTIQKASERSLKNGTTFSKVLGIVRDIRKSSQVPLIFMTYYNLVFAHGLEGFVRASKEAGADGMIISDLPPEEAGALEKIAGRYKFDPVYLAAPTSTDKRLKMISRHSRGFVYYVSLTGVTGARKELPHDIVSSIKKVKKASGRPICVGFGISTPAQAKMVARYADGVIVGSAIINAIEQKKNIYDFIRPFVKAAKG